MSEPITYHGWERFKGTTWRRVPDAIGTQGEVYQALAARAELTNFGEAVPEFMVLPEGELPGAQEYRTRDMRAWR